MTASRYLHVFYCACATKIRKITHVEPNMDSTNSPIILAIHPTLPSVLSPGMQLLDWDLGWMKRQIFWGGIVRTVAFNPGDHNRYAGLSENCEVQVCLAGFLLFTNYKL